jgi:hypothetical protein
VQAERQPDFRKDADLRSEGVGHEIKETHHVINTGVTASKTQVIHDFHAEWLLPMAMGACMISFSVPLSKVSTMPAAIQSKSELISRIRDHRGEILSFAVARLALFGSFARGEPCEESDVDFLVEFLEGGKTFRNFMNLAIYLEDLLHRRVELITPESISPYLKRPILSGAENVLP